MWPVCTPFIITFMTFRIFYDLQYSFVEILVFKTEGLEGRILGMWLSHQSCSWKWDQLVYKTSEFYSVICSVWRHRKTDIYELWCSTYQKLRLLFNILPYQKLRLSVWAVSNNLLPFMTLSMVHSDKNTMTWA